MRFITPSCQRALSGSYLLANLTRARGIDSVKQIRFPLMIVFLLVGVLLLYSEQKQKASPADAAVDRNAATVADQGRNIFRNDTFGDQDFWGSTLQLHRAIEGAQHGGVGPGVSPATALAVGLAPPKNSFARSAAVRGKELFSGKAQCSSCHAPPLMTEPGWNMHAASDVCVDDFQANR